MHDAGVTGTGACQVRPGARPKSAFRLLAAAGAAALLMTLVSCAPEPGTLPVAPNLQPRVELGTVAAPPAPIDASAIPGLFPQRITPSGEPWVSARWSQLPGGNAVNTQMRAWVRAEIDAFTARSGGAAYAPRASPAGSGGASRGCATGSTELTSAQLLADAALAPIATPGSAVLALNCDVLLASGGWFGSRQRSTSVDAAGTLIDTSSVSFSLNGETPEPAATFLAPEKVGELGQLLLGTLGFADLPSLYAPEKIARPVSAKEVEELRLAEIAAEPLPGSDGSMIFLIAIDELPREQDSSSFARVAGWASAGVLQGARVAVRVQDPAAWLSERGTAALAAAATPPNWQPVPAGRQTVDCTLVPCIAVTFDDGPGSDSMRLLDVLASTNSAASFFLLGAATAGAPDIAAAEAAAGHTIGSHSWNHPDLTTLTPTQLNEQIERTQHQIAAATGITPRYFRPPYGALNDKVAAHIPMSIVLWNIDTNDWQNPGEQLLVERVAGAQPGAIILFHDTHASTVDAMPRVIGELQDRGLELVTLDHLLGERPAGVRVFNG